MKSPKQRFLESAAAKTFENIAVSDSFVQALDAAMLQMLSELPALNDPGAVAGNTFRIDGARRFIATLISLPLVTPERKPTKFTDNLEP